MSSHFVDTNIFLRFLTESDPVQADAARTLFSRIRSGQEEAFTSPLVLFEVVFTLHSPRSYNLPKERIAEVVSPLLDLRGLQIPQKKLWFDAFSVWIKYPIDFPDAYDVAYMRSRGITGIYS